MELNGPCSLSSYCPRSPRMQAGDLQVQTGSHGTFTTFTWKLHLEINGSRAPDAWSGAPGIFNRARTNYTPYISRSPLPKSSTSSLLFFFILTLIECREITNTWHYSGEPALHIVVLAAMNCPSGPFRSEFLISNIGLWI